MRIIDIRTGEEHNWSLEQILEEINGDRDVLWVNYDETDWREGWNEWCEGYNYILGE
jgi:hypothetical protein